MISALRNNPVAVLLASGWHYAGKRRPVLIVYCLMFVAALCVTLCEPYVIGKILNLVQQKTSVTISGAQLWHDVSFSLYVYFLLQIVFWAIHGPARVIERYTAFHIKAAYKEDLFATLAGLPLQWHRNHHSGESIDKINRATSALGGFFETSFQVIYMSLRLLGPLVILFWLMPFAGWMGLLTASLAFLNIYIWDKFLYRHYFQINKLENQTASGLQDYATNIGTVITLRLENRVVSEVVRRMFVPLAIFKRNILGVEVKWCLTTMFISIMMLIVLLTYAHNTIAAGSIVLGGSFYTLFEYMRRIGQSFYDFAALYGTIVRQAADVQSADSILKAGVTSTANSANALPQNWATLKIANLNFRYEDEKHRVAHLDDLSIELSAGKSYAIVGESGAGKSTLLTVLRGLTDATDVCVYCDGNRLAQKLSHLKASTTLIPQDPEIFADTIHFNITFGLDGDPEKVMTAVQQAGFEPVLNRLAKGLQTNIAEKGVNLSGGEKQRLALARGLYFAKDCDILLLDEPTSSVDSINEKHIYTNILQQYRAQCIVASVHRLHLLPMFDCIYVLSNGRLVEQGTFEHLIERGGVLANMWQKYQTTAPLDDSAIIVTVPASEPEGELWPAASEEIREIEKTRE